jgi:hypothetical protein
LPQDIIRIKEGRKEGERLVSVERERERERVCFIYIYIERERHEICIQGY